MTCHNCQIRAGKYGKHRNGAQRFRCNHCGRTFTEHQDKLLDDMRVPEEKAILALNCLLEGCSIRSTQRLTGLEKKTVLRLLVLAGEKCQRFMDRRMRGLNCRLIQADEIWSFVFKKDKRVTWRDSRTYGDQYVFVAIDPETKLVPSFIVGKRSLRTTYRFIRDLNKRLRHRTQLSADGFTSYLPAVEDVFGADIDFGQIIKTYHGEVDPGRERYSPGGFISMTKNVVTGAPDEISSARLTSRGKT